MSVSGNITEDTWLLSLDMQYMVYDIIFNVWYLWYINLKALHSLVQ